MILSFIGLVDTTYLTIQHLENGSVICLIIQGCDLVLTSEYSKIFGIPLALLGALYYFLIFSLSVFCFKKRKENTFKFLSFFTTIGFVISVWLVYLQLFVIKSICSYCMVSAFTSISLFIFGLIFLINLRKKNGNLRKL
ncbi:MAG: vitamin K epoxide reductase family protein [Candidatus Paceibacterota bacterium]